jgi:hypothetical protein
MFARVLWALSVSLVAIATSASAQSASSTAQGSVTFVDPVSLTVKDVLTVVAITPPVIPPPVVNAPTVGGGVGGGGGATTTTSNTANTANPGASANTTTTLPNTPISGTGPATYLVRDGGGQTLSVAVPQTLELVQVGGSDQMTLTTTTGIITGSGMDLLGGPLGSGGALSFSVADRVNLFSETELGAYSGLLVLTAQYN